MRQVCTAPVKWLMNGGQANYRSSRATPTDAVDLAEAGFGVEAFGKHAFSWSYQTYSYPSQLIPAYVPRRMPFGSAHLVILKRACIEHEAPLQLACFMFSSIPNGALSHQLQTVTLTLDAAPLDCKHGITCPQDAPALILPKRACFWIRVWF